MYSSETLTKEHGKFHKEMLTSTGKSFVDRTHVDSRLRGLAVGNGYHPDNSHLCVELFGTGFSKLACFWIPARPFNIKTVDEAADVGPHSQLSYCFLHHLNEGSNRGNQRKLLKEWFLKITHIMLFKYATEWPIPMFDLLRYAILLLMVYHISSLLWELNMET